ncbi:flagellar hook assembly protein FlgD [Pseudochelatococcus sp. G4_1912]|uniref:flagellar hook assembly protein FlgD n=1 Tax=Pseudochelatococcus sp. G4_1912 TaxID=3114288 RepID=UPI0039C5FC53
MGAAIEGIGYTPTARTTEPASKTSLDYTAFLRLFTEQLKNQDPTAPMEATDSLAQLATFSQVEQSVMTNKKLDSILSSQSLSQASSVIGRTVTSGDGTVSGKVSSVFLGDTGPVAVLEGGNTVPLGSGISIS